MKFWRILSMVLLKRYSYSLTFLFSSNFSQLKVSIVQLSNWVLVFLQSQANRSYNGGYSIFKFNFAYTIWWWQLGCKEAWTLLPMMKLFWLIKIRWMHEDEFGKIWVVSPISWLKPQDEVIAWTWLPSLAVTSFFHQEDDRTLKSPVTNIKWGFWRILSDIGCSKLRRNWSNSSLLWLGDQYREIKYPFLFWIFFPAQGIHLNLEDLRGKQPNVL